MTIKSEQQTHKKISPTEAAASKLGASGSELSSTTTQRLKALGAQSPNALNDLLEKVLTSARAMVADAEFFVGRCIGSSHSFDVVWCEGSFLPLQGRSIEIGRGPLFKALGADAKLSRLNSDDLQMISPLLTEPAIGEGSLLRLDLSSDYTAVIGFWRPLTGTEKSPLNDERWTALVNLSDLASLAACAADLTLDVQAQQLRLETVRDEIEEVQQFYRRFSNAISQCFWVVDLDLSCLLVVSDNFEQVWGSSRKALQDGPSGFMSAVFPADRDRVLSEFHTHLGTSLSTEFRVITQNGGPDDGEVRWIWLRVYQIHETEEQQEALGRRLVLIADDITEKKVEEETRRLREAELVSRARLQAIGDLSSGVAHEINNPLTIIVGKANEIRQMVEAGKKEDKEKILAHAEKIQKTSIRISEIVSSLKSLSRPDQPSHMQLIPVEKILRDVRDMSSERFKAHHIYLDLPEAPATLAVEMNGTMISQLLFNLLNNAHDAVESLPEKWVKLEWMEDADSIFFYVTDSGSGIPIKIRSRIFDPFFTTKGPGKGTGLGLSLAAGIASHHHGTLSLDNLSPRTRFVVQLPKRQRPK